MKKRPSRFRLEDEEFMGDHKAAFLNKSTFFASSVLYTVIILLFIGLIWSYFGEIDQITIGDGKVIPSTQVKVIQSLDGGIITKILVREGDIVQPNQVLAVLDDTRYVSDYKTKYEKFLALSAAVSRLTAESQNKDTIDFPAVVTKESPELVARETQLFNTRREALHIEMENLQKNLKDANKEVSMYTSLLNKGYVSKVEHIRAQRNVYEIQQKSFEKKDQFHESVWTELNQRKGDLASLESELVALRDKIFRTSLRSPVYGVVKKVNVTTVGGVINPGLNIMEIVPLEDTLLIEARIKPSDVAFVHVGQPATVKITAYDYAIFGNLTGTVEYISPDAIEESKSAITQENQHPQSYYLVNIRTTKNYFEKNNQKHFIIPGMGAMVYIKTGKKTVLAYLLKPLLKAKEEALRER